MFYTQCNTCNKRWELGTASTCKCPDFWEGYVPEPVKPAQQLVDCHATGVCVQSGLRAEQPAQQEPVSFLDWYDNAHWGNEDFKGGCWRAWDAALKHTSPPAQRTWVGLTGKEVMDVTRKEGHELLDFIYEYGTASEGTEERVVAICKAIEAKLKEKNNG